MSLDISRCGLELAVGYFYYICKEIVEIVCDKA